MKEKLQQMKEAWEIIKKGFKKWGEGIFMTDIGSFKIRNIARIKKQEKKQRKVKQYKGKKIKGQHE